MKRKLLSTLVLGCVLTIPVVKAQEKLDCEFNFRQAIFYLQGDKNVERDSLKSVEYLGPCVKAGHAKSQLLMGRLYAGKKDEASYLKAFRLIKKSAKQGNAIAMGDLGVMYKYGRGCNLNYNKARKWFKKGAELRNDKATYSLGYMYLKGFGNIQQNYSKAVKWFKKSKHSMAKYWLGVCYYYGYGVTKDLNKADELLGTDFATTTAESNEVAFDETNIVADNNIASLTDEDSYESKEIEELDLIGTWQGTLLTMDWSGEHIEQKASWTLEVSKDEESNSLQYKVITDEESVTGELTYLANELYFEDLTLQLPHTSFWKFIPNKLPYQLLSGEVSMKKVGGISYVTGTLENYIDSWSESGAPMRFVLQKKETFSNSDKELSDEALQALSEQEQSFIKLYPNPFENDLIISYTLENPSHVEIKVSDIHGQRSSTVERGSLQKAGDYRYFFDGTHLPKGLYVVTITANNQKKTRIIVKK